MLLARFLQTSPKYLLLCSAISVEVVVKELFNFNFFGDSDELEQVEGSRDLTIRNMPYLSRVLFIT